MRVGPAPIGRGIDEGIRHPERGLPLADDGIEAESVSSRPDVQSPQTTGSQRYAIRVRNRIPAIFNQNPTRAICGIER